MRCERHDLALAPDGTCLLCRREASTGAATTDARPRSRAPQLALALVAVLAVGGMATRFALRPPDSASPGAAPATTGTTGGLQTTNASQRTGWFFLPPGYAGTPLPLLVAIHGTGVTGLTMVAMFRDDATRERFIIVAPDSRISQPSGQATWEVPRTSGDTTDDLEHIRRCVAEVRAMAGV
jgi:poly(3-hydroxybutyrate) depolymerase